MQGSTIRQKLSLIGTTQTELARLLEVTPQTVAGILSAADVRTGTMERICRALNLPITFFYEETTRPHAIATCKRPTGAIGSKVKSLLKAQNKKFKDLCLYVGMSGAGMRKMLERNTCNINTLKKIADYFCVPVTHFLSDDQQPAGAESEKDKEILYLRGQVEAYQTMLNSLLAAKKRDETASSKGQEISLVALAK